MAAPMEIDKAIFEQEKSRLAAWLKQLKELRGSLEVFSRKDSKTSLSIGQRFEIDEAGGLIAVRPHVGVELVGVDLTGKHNRPNRDRYTEARPFLGATYLRGTIYNRRPDGASDEDYPETILKLVAGNDLDAVPHGVIVPGSTIPDHVNIEVDAITPEQFFTQKG